MLIELISSDTEQLEGNLSQNSFPGNLDTSDKTGTSGFLILMGSGRLSEILGRGPLKSNHDWILDQSSGNPYSDLEKNPPKN